MSTYNSLFVDYHFEMIMHIRNRCTAVPILSVQSVKIEIFG